MDHFEIYFPPNAMTGISLRISSKMKILLEENQKNSVDGYSSTPCISIRLMYIYQ
jgi:hypothetical protein